MTSSDIILFRYMQSMIEKEQREQELREKQEYTPHVNLSLPTGLD
jgi:hypothetical protein